MAITIPTLDQLGNFPPATSQAVVNLANQSVDVLTAGTALGDTSPTITVGQGRWRTLPAATLTAGRTVTLGTTGAVATDRILITRLDATANTLTVVNGGGGAGTLVVLPVSKVNFAEFQFDGTNWLLRACGTQ